MIDLSTYYLGRKLHSPLVASSSPLSKDLSNLQKMEDAGAGAVVLHSLFEEQILLDSESLDRFLNAGSDSYAESASYFPDFATYDIGPRAYLEHIRAAKRALKIPVIASLNGATLGGWVRYAREMEDAGADALELNIYFLPASFDISGAEIENDYCELVEAVKAHVRIPVAVKLGPFFTSIPHLAYRLECAGAGALVLFNRFYQPDFDLETLEAVPNLRLSTSDELRLRLHCGSSALFSPGTGSRHHRRRSYRRRRDQRHPGRRARRHAHFSAAPAWHPLLARPGGGRHPLDGTARL